MVESVGKKLHQARLDRGLTIDEAAHATRLRPDKIAALESDDYSRFANNIYAKGFLHIYARFLKVDVEDFARTLDNANPISVSDYQYLSNTPAAPRETMPVRRDDRRRPSFAPLFFFIVLVAAGLAASWVYQNYERIQGTPNTRTTDVAGGPSTPVPNPDAAFVSDTPPPVASAPLAHSPPPPAIPRPASAAPGAWTPAPLAAATPLPHTADQDFVRPAPAVTDAPTPHLVPPGGVNEVLVATIKKTWVTVRKDDPKAPPIFEDYVYPNANPLKLKGARFFIEARDPTVVQITKNGLPFAYQPSGVPVQ